MSVLENNFTLSGQQLGSPLPVRQTPLQRLGTRETPRRHGTGAQRASPILGEVRGHLVPEQRTLNEPVQLTRRRKKNNTPPTGARARGRGRGGGGGTVRRGAALSCSGQRDFPRHCSHVLVDGIEYPRAGRLSGRPGETINNVVHLF